MLEVFFDERLVIIYIIQGHIAFEIDCHFNLSALGALKDQVAEFDFLFAQRFAVGAVLPVLIAAFVPAPLVASVVTGSALVLLAVLGAIAAKVGGAGTLRGAGRVVLWGALAMGISALVGRLFGTSV